MTTLDRVDRKLHHYGIYAVLHLTILVLSVYLVVCISIDTFKNLSFHEGPEFMHTQFMICMLFLADFFIEFLLSPHKGHYLKTRWVFFLVSIPWLSIIYHFNIKFDPQVMYVLRYIPLVRGGYALAIVVGWFTSNRASSLFVSYLLTLLSTVYFASLAFFLFEHGINMQVPDYTSALWWAAMDVTTVGSNIVAITPVGRVLSVLLAALGMMMFPIFTVYITNRITNLTAHPGKSFLSLGVDPSADSSKAPEAGHAPAADAQNKGQRDVKN